MATLETKDLFMKCLAGATAAVQQVSPDEFEKPTPDTEWTVRDLAGHLLYELAWVADIVNGKTMEEVGTQYDGDLIAGRLQDNWQLTADRATVAVEAADLEGTAHLSYGTVTVRDYLEQIAADLLIHAWDLSTALGQPLQFENEVAQYVYDYTLPRQDDLKQSGLFAEAVQVPDDAELQTKLLALYGRDRTAQEARFKASA
ncbi:TIGR03086 family protein [Candidatus Saccharibacteria bacterium]|nr:TIGR03086 family protein [Candidatus Saccharibacteria bacterium]